MWAITWLTKLVCLVFLFLHLSVSETTILSYSPSDDHLCKDKGNQSFWHQLLEVRKDVNQVVLVSNEEFCDFRFMSKIYYSPSEFGEEAITRVQDAVTEINIQPLFLIIDPGSEKKLRSIIRNIRLYSSKTSIIIMIQLSFISA